MSTTKSFRRHRLVQELFVTLGSKSTPEENEEKDEVQREVSAPLVVPRSELKVLAHRSPNPEAFREMYEMLNARKVDSLPGFVNLLMLISQDKKLREYLHYKANKPFKTALVAQPTTTDGQRITLPEILSRVRSAASTHSKQLSSSKPHKEAEKKYKHPNLKPPVVPDWPKLRPHMTLDFSQEPVPELRPLTEIPVSSQENLLMEDLLYVLSGLEGEYIVPHPLAGPFEPRTFAISEGTDPSLRQLVLKILPLASCYSTVVRFIEEKSMFKYGTVNQALAGAMRLLVDEYQIFLAQLEVHVRGDSMNLQSFWFYAQPTFNTMEILANIATTISRANCHGGKVLSLLHEHTTSVGDPKARNLCLLLTQAACVPFMEILQKWIYKGVIEDPYEEFLVEDNELIQKEDLPVNYSDEYWEKRYIIRRDHIPVFLEKIADIILRTGKYLNVIRQCGKNVKSPQAKELRYTPAEREYHETIKQAYSFASQTLLDLLMKENDLMGRLRSAKHYFLHDQGDFIVQLMDMCEGELAKNINDIVPHRLESLLELALRTSTANSDPYKDDMRAVLLPFDLTHQMFKIHGIREAEEREMVTADKLTGLESFSFGYEVKWPVSLVFTLKSIACYQIIFRHLFYCNYVERMLCRVWLSNKVCKMFPVSSSQSYRPAFVLRQRMLNCIQNLQYYMMVEVIEPNWLNFNEKMTKAEDVDEVLTLHADFICLCLKECMLTCPDLLHTVNRVIAVCVEFCRFFERAQRYFVDAELNSMIAASDGESDVSEAAPSIDGPFSAGGESFEKSIADLDMRFSTALILLLNKIQDIAKEDSNHKMLNVLYRLDFYSYYKSSLLSNLTKNVLNEATTDAPYISG